MKKRSKKNFFVRITDNKYFLFISLISIMILISVVAIITTNSITSNVVFQRQQNFGEITPFTFGYALNTQSLLDLYIRYSEWFDFIIFFIVFFSIGHLAFKERFGGNSTLLAVMLSIFLAFGVLIFERQYNISLGDISAQLIPPIIVFLAAFVVYFVVSKLTGKGTFAFGLALLIWWYLWWVFIGGCDAFNLFGFNYYSYFIPVLGLLCWIYVYIVPFIAIILAIYGLFRKT